MATLAVLALAAGCTTVGADQTTADRTTALYASVHIDAGEWPEITLRDGEQDGIATLTWELAEPVDATVTLRMPDPHDPEGAAGSGFNPGAVKWAAGETGERTTAITTSKALLNREPDLDYDNGVWWLWVRPMIEVGDAQVPATGIRVEVTRE